MNRQLKPLALPNSGGQSFSAIDPLDSRYFDQEISSHLSEASRVAYQAYVEAALAQTLADFKICSRKVANEIEASARTIDIKKVYKEEQTTRHDIKAVVNVIKKNISNEAKPYVHFGATSYDIVSTASALQLKITTEELVVPRLKNLISTLVELTDRYSQTIQIGRTHGQHAIPITFGFAMSEYVSRLGNSCRALEDLAGELRGKFSGAVGSYNALSIFIDDPMAFEYSVLEKLGLKPTEFSNQISPPEYVVRLIDELTITAGIMANLGHDMRHLQRSEIGEVRERFEPGQTGSSTMAQKKNPWNFENVVSMSKQVIAQSVNANLNLSSEHQRDLTDSASARFYSIVPALVASMAKRLNNVMDKVEVDKEAMERNLKLTGGAIAAEPLYLLFEKHGHTAAHEMAKRIAHRALEEGLPMVDLILGDKEAIKYWDKFSPSEKKIVQQPEKYYTGLAAKKAKLIAKRWSKYL